MRWISVDDSLPLREQDVLMYTNYDEMVYGFYDSNISKWRQHHDYIECDGASYFNDIIEKHGTEVTHWMIPRPPEIEE
ncbi:DUF551 domain-containing protein [Photorhabdus caribbeanensis]|uniref:DUF551 domain-containing protein n=1 Tax=Photorhabdus caribbeanensis TaxID=1004165 RepID=UPI001BD6235C|nr:DUF551 domain-containing protein [Photorhabdus caribbeanensis]